MIKAANQLKTQFRLTFTGRHSGAIGGFHPVTEIYETDPRKDWNGWLREHYEKGDANRYGGPILNVEEIEEDREQ